MFLPASLCPLSGFYPLRPVQTDSLIRLVFAGVSACIVKSSQRILSASPGTKNQILGSCLRVSLPASLCPLSGFYPLRPLQTDSLIRLVFAGVSACIVMSSQRILSASPGTKIQILGSCLRVSLPASLCPLSGFYPLRPLQTDSLIRLVFAGVSACIVMSSQRILSASPGTKIQILGSCLRVSLPASLCPLSGFYLLRPLKTDSLIRLVFAGVSACIVMSSQRILSASPGTKIQILGSCLRVSLPASLCPLSGFYPLRPLQTDSLIRLVFAGVSACIVMSSQRILSASPGTKIQILGSCLRVSLPASLCPLSGFYPLRPL